MLLEFIFCHLFLVITLWVRSTSALRDFLTSSSSVSGKESIAAAARFACFAASSLVLCIPRLFPRYSRAWIHRRDSSDKLTLISMGKKKKQMTNRQKVETIRASNSRPRRKLIHIITCLWIGIKSLCKTWTKEWKEWGLDGSKFLSPT